MGIRIESNGEGVSRVSIRNCVIRCDPASEGIVIGPGIKDLVIEGNQIIQKDSDGS